MALSRTSEIFDGSFSSCRGVAWAGVQGQGSGVRDYGEDSKFECLVLKS